VIFGGGGGGKVMFAAVPRNSGTVAIRAAYTEVVGG
jgi:hypothetical protein